MRGVVDNNASVLWSSSYDPFGTGYGATGTPQTLYGFTGEMTDGNGLLHLRARSYHPYLAAFLSLDPLEGTPARPMSLNGYTYVEGNPTNMVDPSGMVGERPKMWDTCGDEAIPCCGPDATKWIYNEIGRHMNYAAREWGAAKLIAAAASSNLYGLFVLNWRIMTYGLAVDYSNIKYRSLERISNTLADIYPASGTKYIATPHYSCNGNQREEYVSVCGRCHHASDFGNFILGAGIAAGGFPRAVAWAAGEIYKLISNDTNSGADVSGVTVGWDYAVAGLYNTDHNLDQFCLTLDSMGTSWFDRERNDCGCIEELGGTPCKAPGPNLHHAPQTEPNWNTYMSDLTGHIQPYASPQQELCDKSKLPAILTLATSLTTGLVSKDVLEKWVFESCRIF